MPMDSFWSTLEALLKVQNAILYALDTQLPPQNNCESHFSLQRLSEKL